MKTAILGATGYTGAVLLRILQNHPDITDIIPCSSSVAGEELFGQDTGLWTRSDKYKLTGGKMITAAEALAYKPDVVFAALPHLKSAPICADFLGTSVVIDLSADLRIEDPALFVKAYGEKAPREDLLGKAVYGLCEHYGDIIKKSDLIANPGCYPTCSLLPLLPVVKNLKIKGPVVVNALSGISGAGKKATVNNLFCERTESTCAYLTGQSHRHVTEIQKELAKKNKDALLVFNPHLVPLKRGMHASIFVEIDGTVTEEKVGAILNEAYGNSPCVQLTGSRQPDTRDVWGTNRCDIGWKVVDGRFVQLFSVIDNLVKGASGQAVQNMNIRFGLSETAGLEVNGAV